ncbi:MAG: hypothetical protein U9R17_18495 [Thermodesulfobacteriota bacterium]|nr:hypothetical protein [Thermodesulfobacteriota bacterium]
MLEKFKLEVEKGTGDNYKVSLITTIDMIDSKGSSVSGKILLTPKCISCKAFEAEVFQIKEQLDKILIKSRQIFEAGGGEDYSLSLDENLSDKGLWNIMSTIKNVDILLEKFNGMSHQKRVEVADYILSHANIFSGTGSIFSERYNSEKGILE